MLVVAAPPVLMADRVVQAVNFLVVQRGLSRQHKQVAAVVARHRSVLVGLLVTAVLMVLRRLRVAMVQGVVAVVARLLIRLVVTDLPDT